MYKMPGFLMVTEDIYKWIFYFFSLYTIVHYKKTFVDHAVNHYTYICNDIIQLDEK